MATIIDERPATDHVGADLLGARTPDQYGLTKSEFLARITARPLEARALADGKVRIEPCRCARPVPVDLR